MKTALIFGVTGQDGSYLAEELLQRGYRVYGARRRVSIFNTQRIDHLIQDDSSNNRSKITLLYADLLDPSSILHCILTVKPDEIYNLAGQSHVAVSFETPDYTSQTMGLGVLRILEAIRIYRETHKNVNPIFYQASTSEMYGNSLDSMQNEMTRMNPVSPYGAAKLYAHDLTRIYREGFGVFASTGILFNHESPRRGQTFLPRKVSLGVARISKGYQKSITLGNLNAERDWGHAKEYVRAMIDITSHHQPDDFVIATGKVYSVRDLVKCAFSVVGIEIIFTGEGISEKGIDSKTGQELVNVSEKYFRPYELHSLCGDSSKAKRLLDWEARIGFQEIIEEMVEQDLRSPISPPRG